MTKMRKLAQKSYAFAKIKSLRSRELYLNYTLKKNFISLYIVYYPALPVRPYNPNFSVKIGSLEQPFSVLLSGIWLKIDITQILLSS